MTHDVKEWGEFCGIRVSECSCGNWYASVQCAWESDETGEVVHYEAHFEGPWLRVLEVMSAAVASPQFLDFVETVRNEAPMLLPDGWSGAAYH